MGLGGNSHVASNPESPGFCVIMPGDYNNLVFDLAGYRESNSIFIPRSGGSICWNGPGTLYQSPKGPSAFRTSQ